MQHQQSLLDSIARGLSDKLGGGTEAQWVRNLPGGDVNYAAQIRWENSNWFVKYHARAPAGMFAAEALALEEIVKQGCIKAPRPVTHGNDGDMDWLVLEYINLGSSGPASLLGEELAALHTITHEQYGWERDNYIGTTPQQNTRCDDWSGFWRDYRIKPQLELARSAGHGGWLQKAGGRLLERMDQLLGDHKPAASLLHGDLWAGNKAFTAEGRPVIFDPATYYGDRETDIAMTELFGGFSSEFYAAYEANCPLPCGYQQRRELYNLYHMLNHLNLFGRGYLSRCENMVNMLLAELG